MIVLKLKDLKGRQDGLPNEKKMRRAVTRLGIVLLVCFGCTTQVEDEPVDLITASNAAWTDEAVDGKKVLTRAVAAYESLQSYVGSTHVTCRTYYDPNDFDEGETSATIWFKRPRLVRVDGRIERGIRFGILSDGDHTWRFWPIDTLQGGGWKLSDGVPKSILSFSGVSANATTLILSTILGIEWSCESIFLPRGRLLSAFATDARLKGEQLVGGVKCHHVVCVRDIGTWSFFVDKSTYLLLQAEVTANPQQMSMQRQHGGGGTTGRIVSMSRIERYTIEKVDAAIDDEIFKAPR